MNASPTMGVAMALVPPPGNVPVKRAGEAYSVIKVSEGKERMQRVGEMGKGRELELSPGPSLLGDC